MSEMIELREMLLELAGEKVRADGWVNAAHVAREALRALEAQEQKIVELSNLIEDHHARFRAIRDAGPNPTTQIDRE